MPTVSVVVPAYNNADFIEATVSSILAQTHTDLEIVVADHSSSDRTKEIVEGFDDDRLAVVDTPAGGGAAANWNRVSALATADHVTLVCGDDLLRPTSIERRLAALQAHPSAVMAASRRDLVDARGEVFLRDRGLGDLAGLVPGADAIRATVRAGTNIFGEPACVLMRRTHLERAGFWDASKSYFIDAASYARVLEQGDLVAVPEPLAAFRVSASQWSVRLMAEQASQAAQFHAEMARRFATVTAADVRRGDAMAKLAALQRRAAYLVLGKRMRPLPGS